MRKSTKPRGDVPIQAIVDLSHHRCPLAFAIDPYGETCPFGCIYCYATETKAPVFSKIDLDELESLVRDALAGKGSTAWHDMLRRRVPLRIGWLRDPLPQHERTKKYTRQLIELLNRHDYPLIVFTKSAMIAEEGYPELLTGKHTAVQISLTTLDADISAHLEPHAPLPIDRLEAIAKLRRLGVRAVARVNPLVRKIEIEGRLQDCFSLELLDEIKRIDANGVIFGTLNSLDMPEDKLSTMVPREEPSKYLEFIDGIVEHCRKIDLTFTLCQLGPRPKTFPVDPAQKVGGCCQVDESLLPFGVSTWTRLSCGQLGAMEKVALWSAHVMMNALHDS